MRMDFCASVRYQEHKSDGRNEIFRSLIIAYVGDIAIAAYKQDCGRFATTMKKLEEGFAYLETNAAMDLIGRQMEKGRRLPELSEYGKVYPRSGRR